MLPPVMPQFSFDRMHAFAGFQVATKWPALLRKALFLPLLIFAAAGLQAAEQQVTAPGGELVVTVSDAGGLNYRVEANGKLVITNSPLGLE